MAPNNLLGIIFYCHNLGGYDVVFLLKSLYDYNQNHEDKYILNPIFRDNKIIRLTIKKDNGSIVLSDSYALFNSKLEKLGKDFEVKTQKSLFPYRFSTKNNLFYIGNKLNEVASNEWIKFGIKALTCLALSYLSLFNTWILILDLLYTKGLIDVDSTSK